MASNLGKISVICANLPGRVDLGPIWCMFNLICPVQEEGRFRAELREKLGAFMKPESRVIFLAEGAEQDMVDTINGEEDVLILTAFLTVGSISVDKALTLNAVLVDLFGIAPDDPQSVIQELVGP